MNAKLVLGMLALLVVGVGVGAALGYYVAPPKIVEKPMPIGVEVGKTAPQFSLPSTLDRRLSLTDFRGKWIVLFFFPAAYTPICKSEVQEFNNRLDEFKKLNTEVVGASVDDVNTLKKWSGELGGIKYPLLSDVGGETSRRYGSYTFSSIQEPIKGKAVSMRGTFIIDPEGIVRYVLVHDELVGRSVAEIIRVLEALQSGAACPVEWQPPAP